MYQWLTFLSLPLWLLDQVTKQLIARQFFLGETREVIPHFFNLVYTTNRGAAFGFLQDGAWANIFFTILASTALVVIVLLWRKNTFDSGPLKLAAALLVAGILGNLTDRLWHGAVIDFLDFYWGNWHFPAFNVADSCITVAAGLLILSSFRAQPPPAQPEETP